MLRRSFDGANTTYTVYAFGLEEHQYNSSGTNTANTSYYTLGGRLVGALTGTSTKQTNFFLTDVLGSVVSNFSNTPNSAALLGNQGYGPYGNQRYIAGSMGTAKGFTGQYNDVLTGLDYYNARYYDAAVGRFPAADTKQGNPQGMHPYVYVGGNPETATDPTGESYILHLGGGGAGSSSNSPSSSGSGIDWGGWGKRLFFAAFPMFDPHIVDTALGISSMINDVKTILDPHASGWQSAGAKTDLSFNLFSDALLFVGVGEAIRGAQILGRAGVDTLRVGL